jgi:hypothetical protein
VPPENIDLDESLAQLQFVGPAAGRARAKATPKRLEGLRNAEVLRSDCRRLVARVGGHGGVIE